jgi:uncharacterized membrane protein YeiB
MPRPEQPEPVLPTGAPPAGVARDARIAGLDVARSLAILGMMVVHYVPYHDPDRRPGAGFPDPSLGQELLFGIPSGRASSLFAVLAGVGLGLLLARADRPVSNVLRRAAVLAVLGLLLVPAWGGMILHFFAFWFVVGLLVRRLPDAWLLGLAVALLPIGWFGAMALGGELGAISDPSPLDPILRASEFWPNFLFTHFGYPAVLWFSFVLFGMWLGRRRLLERRRQVALLVGGAVAVAAMAGVAALAESAEVISSDPELAALFDDRPHTVGFPYMVGAAGSAVLAIGGCLLLATAFPRTLRPLAAAGQISLTLYLLHLVPLVFWLGDRPSTLAEYGDHPAPVEFLFPLGVFAAFVLAASAWLAHFERGPVEAGLRWFAAWSPRRRSTGPLVEGREGG